MDDLLNRFTRYVHVNTQSCLESNTSPSSLGEWDLLHLLSNELTFLNVKYTLSKYGYLFATIPSNISKKVETIGFLAHIDTAIECSGKDVKPQVFKNYNGNDIELGNKKILSQQQFPFLKELIGNTLVTTSGDTLLGGDDKAGVTILMSIIKFITKNHDFKHGELKFGFTPDEEIGKGYSYFDIKDFGADYAFTIDNPGTGIYSCETFNAATAYIDIQGITAHPGTAKGKMINANRLAIQFDSMIPECQRPEYTDYKEGFYHLLNINSDVSNTKMSYLLRDFEREGLQKRIDTLQEITAFINKKYGSEYVKMYVEHSYQNMKEVIVNKAHFLIDIIEKAITNVGLQPESVAVRGGTDGARLSYMGLPCPNIFCGTYNCHSVYEVVSLESMNKSKETILEIIKLFCNR